MPKSWFKAQKAGTVGELAIYSDIGAWGVTANHFRQALDGLGDVDTLKVRIASDGGDIATGFAIYNMLASHPAHKVVTVEGLAASMASVVAMVGDEVRIPKNAMLMIHNPWGSITGSADQIESFAEALNIMRENIVDAYVQRTGLTAEKVAVLMDKETWLSAEKAVKLGFADTVIEPAEMKASVNLTKFNKVPASFGKVSVNSQESVMTEKTAEQLAAEKAEKVAATKAVRDSLKAQAKEVRSLCALAGMPELAEGFVDEDKSVSDVIVALDAEKAKRAADTKGKGKKPGSGATDELSARHNTNTAAGQGEAKVIDPGKIWNKWNSAGRKSDD
jgi:ATP-dependent Clp protease protease subunit